jgi:hypothetical protein
MRETRYKSGDVSVSLDFDLERFISVQVGSISRQVGDALLEQLEPVAIEAENQWYQQVDRKTGRSGQIAAVLTYSLEAVRVDVGSLDRRTSKTGKPVVVFIKRPSATSTILEPVSAQTWYDTDEIMRSKYPFIKRRNPKASDGKNLLNELIKKPVKAKRRALVRLLSQILGKKGR